MKIEIRDWDEKSVTILASLVDTSKCKIEDLWTILENIIATI